MKLLWQRLSKRERTLVVLSLLVLLLVLGQYFFIDPLLERRRWVKSQLEIQGQLFEKNLRYFSQKAQITASLKKARGKLEALERSLLSGDTPSVSASTLQRAVRDVASREGMKIVTTRVLNPEPMGPFLRIPIQVQVRGEIEQLVNLIKGIESDSQLLVVSEINIFSLVARGSRRRRPTPQGGQGLRAALVISGFSRPQASQTGQPKASYIRSR
ncbi:MAG: type II secretion system protein GspM [Candidatus Binatia bacterium]